jgi:hypothetical protein
MRTHLVSVHAGFRLYIYIFVVYYTYQSFDSVHMHSTTECAMVASYAFILHANYAPCYTYFICGYVYRYGTESINKYLSFPVLYHITHTVSLPY